MREDIKDSEGLIEVVCRLFFSFLKMLVVSFAIVEAYFCRYDSAIFTLLVLISIFKADGSDILILRREMIKIADRRN